MHRIPRVAKEVGPKREALQSAEASLAAANKALAAQQAKLAQVGAHGAN